MQAEHVEDAGARASMEQIERLQHELATAVARADGLERELANERELRQTLEDAANDDSLIQTLVRMIDRHSTEMQNERTRHWTEMDNERTRLYALMDAATIRHERSILELAGLHRREVSARLDTVLSQNEALLSRVDTFAAHVAK